MTSALSTGPRSALIIMMFALAACGDQRAIALCGNGVVDRGEQCDDGNADSGDGCERDCSLPSCGNGIQDPGESCDDGNARNGDGCDSNCTVTACGNAAVDASEACDDGNTSNGDGCDVNCTLSRCGNGIADASEECDDGNTRDGDDCDRTCATSVSARAYPLVDARVRAVRDGFYVYRDQDAGVNHGLPSGLFGSPGNLGTMHVNVGCVDDPDASDGCSTDPTRLDRVRGTVLQLRFDPQSATSFVGFNFEEPEHYGAAPRGVGYDLRGATTLVLQVRAPQPVSVAFNVGLCDTTAFFDIPPGWTELRIGLNTRELVCMPDLSNVHFPFGIVTNGFGAPNGGTLLIDNVRFEPVPPQQLTELGFPLGNESFGVSTAGGALPPDPVLRNLTTTYETALSALALLARGSDDETPLAALLADTLGYALHHDNQGDPLPVGSDGSLGLHNGYEDGNVALLNAQGPGAGQAGDIRLAGFTAPALCPATGFCILFDGATGGNNAFAILALTAAYRRLHTPGYLDDAETIGRWIVDRLADRSGHGYDGYALGYPDGTGTSKLLQTGKSVENNADIFAAFMILADLAAGRGDSDAAARWTADANLAGDFVMSMYDEPSGRFFAGTLPVGTPPAPGLCPDGPVRGDEQINTCDFLDANSFVVLAMAGAARYHDQIDWRRPIQYSLAHFQASVAVGDERFDGFDLIDPASGSSGIAWEFTGQMVVALRYLDAIYQQAELEPLADRFLAEIRHAQRSAPFGDGLGLVAGTMTDGAALPPVEQCLATPFQCIPERVGLAATTWAILADRNVNPFLAPAP